MTFTSYAQNFEDVMLWRALKHIPNGCYVDVGAQHPVVDSVSKAFYEHGWRGIHVEPVRQFADLLRADRPDETVLEIALADKAGILELNVIADTGLSTGVKAFAESHQSQHGFEHQTVQVPMLPLRSALPSLSGREVHWLKIDVEGLEEDVLRGWDSTTLRPWIIVIEATRPMSTEPHYEGSDKLLLAADYKHVYFDGLNRFYVASEHGELARSFEAPPNVFDRAELSLSATGSWCGGAARQIEHWRQQSESDKAAASAQALNFEQKAQAFEQRKGQLEASLAQARTRAAELQGQAGAMQAQASAMQAHIGYLTERVEQTTQYAQGLLTSTSWRITRPLRFLAAAARGQLSPHTIERLARIARRVGLHRVARAVYTRLFKRTQAAAPASTARAPNANAAHVPSAAWSQHAQDTLSDEAQRVLAQLQPQHPTTRGKN